ncbi:MAG TPA: TIR domain-containing protein [Hyphomonadaceae bacterium]|nr:TIR domain-containing protein [Hyphomonadaceae bacterium]
MADVFLSYKSDDRAAAQRVSDALAEAGYAVWWDTAVIAGEHFNSAVERELLAAKCVLVLWTHASHRSNWVQAEALHAFEKKNLVCARLDDVAVKYPFGSVQIADLRQWLTGQDLAAIKSVLVGVGDKVGRSPKGLTDEERSTLANRDKLKGAAWSLAKTLKGHQYEIFHVSFSRNSALLGTTSTDSVAKVWDVASWQLIDSKTLDPDSSHPGVLKHSIEFAGESGWVITARSLSGLHAWNLRTGQKNTFGSRGGERTLGGNLCAVSSDGRMATSGGLFGLVICNLTSGKATKLSGRIDGEEITALALSPTGDLCFAGDESGKVTVWKARKGLLGVNYDASALRLHAAKVTSLCVTLDGRFLLSSSEDHTAGIYDLQANRLVARLEGHVDIVTGVTATADASMFATSSKDSTVKLWDSTGALLHPNLLSRKVYAGSGASAVAFSPNNRYLAVGLGDKVVEIWERAPA